MHTKPAYPAQAHLTPKQSIYIACPGTGFLPIVPLLAGFNGLSTFPASLTVLALCLFTSFPDTCFIGPGPPEEALDCARTRPAGDSGRGTDSAEAKEFIELTLPPEAARLAGWPGGPARRLGGGPSRFLRGSLERQERGTTPCWVPSRRLHRAWASCVSGVLGVMWGRVIGLKRKRKKKKVREDKETYPAVVVFMQKTDDLA